MCAFGAGAEQAMWLVCFCPPASAGTFLVCKSSGLHSGPVTSDSTHSQRMTTTRPSRRWLHSDLEAAPTSLVQLRRWAPATREMTTAAAPTSSTTRATATRPAAHIRRSEVPAALLAALVILEVVLKVVLVLVVLGELVVRRCALIGPLRQNDGLWLSWRAVWQHGTLRLGSNSSRAIAARGSWASARHRCDGSGSRQTRTAVGIADTELGSF